MSDNFFETHSEELERLRQQNAREALALAQNEVVKEKTAAEVESAQREMIIQMHQRLIILEQMLGQVLDRLDQHS